MAWSEEEQLQLFKDWWQRYKRIVVIISSIILLVISSWYYWYQRQLQLKEQASIVYMQLLLALEQQKVAETKVYAEHLLKYYPATPYGDLASLVLAKVAIIHNDYLAAKKSLQWILDYSQNRALRQLARNRLARLLLQQQQAQAALDLLKSVDDLGFQSEIQELQGDAYIQLKQPVMAKQAYLAATQQLAATPEVANPLLPIKLRQF